jgi:hypothetical protein
MKQIITGFFFIVLQFDMLFAQQSVGIGTTTPNASAQLDIVSTNKGILIPRMTGAQRTAIPTPPIGLMVIQTNTETVPPSSAGLYLYEQVGITGIWRRIARTDEITGGTSSWTVNAANQYSNVAGNVGIGTVTPTSKFHVVGNVLQDNGTLTMNNAAAAIQLQNAGVNKGFMQLSGNNLKLGTSNGNSLGKLVIGTDGSDKVFVDSTGNMQIIGEQVASLTEHGHLMLGSTNTLNMVMDMNVIAARNNGTGANLYLQPYSGNIGIGAVSPNEKLDISGNFRLSGNSSRAIKFETTQATNALTTARPGISFIRDNNTLLGRMEYVDTFGLANFMRFRMGEDIVSGLTINTSNNVGVGTVDPNAKLHIRGGDGEQLRINHGFNPFVQFTTGGGNLVENKRGFLDVSGDDFRIGTNTENNAGKFIVRVNGNNTINISPNNNVGIGVDNPTQKLQVAGNSIVTGYAIIGGTANIGGNTAIAGDLTMDAVNPIIQLQNSGVDKGFVQLSTDNIRIGTNGGNTNGKFVIRTNGGDRFFVDANGNVNIGSQTDAPGYMLRVGGRMICEEVKVKLQSSGWPDYVFAESYKLPSLSVLNEFIQKHKHLPNIPSAKEVEKNGLEIGDMQKRMMEKIEELTLYIIQQQKEIDELKGLVKKINNRRHSNF